MSKDKLIPELRFPEFKNEEEWDSTTLDDLCELITKGTTPTTLGFSYTESGVNFIKIESILEGNINLEKAAFISIECNEALKRSQLKEDDILFSIAGALGVVSTVTKEILPANTNQALSIVRLKNKKQKDYLKAFLKSNLITSEVQKIKAGAAQPNISLNQVANFSILIPKNTIEQQRIASCLSSLDEVITAHTQKLDLLKNHKKGLMQNLFPQEGETMPKYRFKEFEKDGEWVEEVLGGICDVRDGTHDSPKYVSKGYPMITSKNLLINGMIDFDNVSYLSEDDYNQINKRSKVDIDDILFGMIGTIGNPVIIKNDGFAIKNVALIKGIGKLNQEFLLHQLKSNYILTQFDKVNAGGILKFIALGVIRNLTVIVPSIKEQQKIASCLSSLDALITAQAEKIEQLKLHKKGLMQGLFPKIID